MCLPDTALAPHMGNERGGEGKPIVASSFSLSSLRHRGEAATMPAVERWDRWGLVVVVGLGEGFADGDGLNPTSCRFTLTITKSGCVFRADVGKSHAPASISFLLHPWGPGRKRGVASAAEGGGAHGREGGEGGEGTDRIATDDDQGEWREKRTSEGRNRL